MFVARNLGTAVPASNWNAMMYSKLSEREHPRGYIILAFVSLLKFDASPLAVVGAEERDGGRGLDCLAPPLDMTKRDLMTARTFSR